MYVTARGKRNSLLEKNPHTSLKTKVTMQHRGKKKTKTITHNTQTEKTYHKKNQFWNSYSIECKVPQYQCEMKPS